MKTQNKISLLPGPAVKPVFRMILEIPVGAAPDDVVKAASALMNKGIVNLNDVTVQINNGCECVVKGDMDCHLCFVEDIRGFLEAFARQHTGGRGLVLVAVKEDES